MFEHHSGADSLSLSLCISLSISLSVSRSVSLSLPNGQSLPVHRNEKDGEGGEEYTGGLGRSDQLTQETLE